MAVSQELSGLIVSAMKEREIGSQPPDTHAIQRIPDFRSPALAPGLPNSERLILGPVQGKPPPWGVSRPTPHVSSSADLLLT